MIHTNPKHLLEITVTAVITGFFLSILIGPVFFMLLETSIRKGVRAALAFDLGVLLSDLFYIALAFFFYSEISKLLSGDNKYLIKTIGGGIFIIMGIVSLIKKTKAFDSENQDDLYQAKDLVVLFIKGFWLNFANPMVIFYWLNVIAIGAKKTDTDELGDNIIYYIAIILITFFTLDVLKIVGAKKLRPFITQFVLTLLNRLIGLILLGTGIWLMLKGFKLV